LVAGSALGNTERIVAKNKKYHKYIKKSIQRYEILDLFLADAKIMMYSSNLDRGFLSRMLAGMRLLASLDIQPGTPRNVGRLSGPAPEFAVRHLNVVVVVSCVNELSLLCGFLGRFFYFRAVKQRGLLLSCHIVVSPSFSEL